MKLHLPTPLRAALMAAFTAVISLCSATSAATYSNLTEVTIDADNHVYYDGKGTFYVQSPQVSTLDVTIDLNQFVAYQGSNDYTGFTPFVGWTFANGISDGIADVSTKNNASSYTGLTGYYGSNKYALSGNGQSSLTLETLQSYATDNSVTVTVKNNITGGVSLTLGSGDNAVTYTNTGLKFSNSNTSTTAYSVNLNYVTAVTLNTASTLDTDSFELPPDYSQPFHSERWDAGDKTSLGRVLFVGDSITHGIADQTWRWQIFKTFVDNGIENEIAGPRSDYDTRFANTTSDRADTSYGGVEFTNEHLAQSSGRTHNIISGSASGSGVNYGGWSTAKTATAYDADTVICLMGTNDILSDAGAYNTKFAKLLGGTVTYDEATKEYTWTHTGEAGSWGEWGTMATITSDLTKQDSDTVYVMSIPTWGIRNDLKYGPNGNVDVESAHYGVQEYNKMLKQWTEAYSAASGKNVKYVEINRGLVDLTDSVSFKGYSGFFREGSDQLHPTEQGSIIIAGNLAQGMGLAGRTAGLERSGVGYEGHGWHAAESDISLSAGDSLQAISNAFTIEGGYTIDFNGIFGDGAANGWKGMSNCLSVTIGDGTNSGTLKLSEGYIMWGDTVLFCQDNHLTDNDNIRIAYHEGSTADNIGSGYYVWLDDMLIGQALTASTGNSMNGVTLSSAGGSAVVTGLAYTDTAYAPSTTLITANANGLTDGGGFVPTPPSSNPDVILTPMPNHNSEAAHLAGVSFGAATTTGQYATTNQAASGAIAVTRTGTVNDSWIGAVGANHTGNVDIRYNNLQTTKTVILTVVNTSVTEGRVSVVLDGGTQIDAKGHFQNSGDHSFLGVYRGNVDGAMQLEVNDATLQGGILMGHADGTGRITGGTKLIVNEGATIGGDIFGGSSSAGSIAGGTDITITGGTVNGNIYGGNRANDNAQSSITGGTAITITGGRITGNVVGGNESGSAGTIAGGTAVTVDGVKASIGGNITADTVALKNVTNSGHTDGFDQYKGTVTATNLELNNYTADEVKAQLVGEHLTVTGKSATNVSNLNLTACDITVEEGSSLTLSGTQTYGHTVSYSGAVTIAQGTTFTVSEPSDGVRPGDFTSGANGFKYEGYVYDILKPTETGSGYLLSEDGQPLGLTTNLTLKGTGDLEGAFFVYKADTGILSAFEKIITDTCYINTGVLTYGKETGAYGATESLQLANGATLVMADNLAENVTINSDHGTVTLLDKVQLSEQSFAAGSTATLTGTGTFALSPVKTVADMSMPEGYALDADEWKGTILLTSNGSEVTNITASALNALAPNSDAWVELNNVKGYFEANNVTVRSNLRLMGDKALVISNGYGGKTYTFTGDIAGDGVISHNYANFSYVFEGDISNWVGALKGADNKSDDMGVTLKGKATTLNAALKSSATGSSLNLTLGAITDGSRAYTFNNEVLVKNLSADGQKIVIGAADDVVPGGSLTVKGSAVIKQLTLEENTTATFNGTSVRINASGWNDTAISAAKGTLSFADGTSLKADGSSEIGTLIIGNTAAGQGGTLTYAEKHNTDFSKLVTIHNLQSAAGAELRLVRDFATSQNTTYVLGGSNSAAASNTFSGAICFDVKALGNGQAQLVIADTNIAADAQLTLNNTSGKTAYVGIAADTVKLQGIADAEGSTSAVKIYSGNTGNGTVNGATDGRVRTLELTGSGNYSSSAAVGANLNLLISGTGSQTFTGDMSDFNGTFATRNAGLVTLATGSANLGALNVQNNDAANAATLQFSAKTGADNTYTFSTWDMSGSGNTGKKWMVVDEGVTVHGTGSGIGANHDSTVNNGWGIAGGGFEVNGTLITDGVISMDGPGASTFKGTGTIQTVGFNVSNGSTTTVQGGVTIDVTSAKGVYKRDGGASTLNLADAKLAATTADWELKSSINTVNLTSADKGTTFETAAGRTITVSKAMGGSGALVKEGAGTLALNAANTFTGGTTVNGGTLLVGNASALGTGAVTVNEGAALAAGEGIAMSIGSLTLNTGASIDFGTAATVGTLHIGGLVTLGSTLSGSLSALTEGSLTLFSGVSSFTVGGNDFVAGTAIDTVFSGVDASKYVLNYADNTVSITLAAVSNNIVINADSHETTITGGTYDNLISESNHSIVLEGATTISGGITMEGDASASLAEGATVSNKGVTITGTGSESSISGSETEAAFAVNNAAVTVDTVAEGETATLEGALVNSAVTNNSGAELIVSGGDSTVTKMDILNAAEINFTNVAEKVEVEQLTLSAGATVGVFDGELKAIEKGLTVTETLIVDGDSVMNANLTVAEGVTMFFNGTLTMGSTVDLAEGTDIYLSESLTKQFHDGIILIDSIDAESDINTLIGHNVYGVVFDDNGDAVRDAEGQLTYQFLTTTLAGTNADGTHFMATPEPATATLSLLALTALVARRRRK